MPPVSPWVSRSLIALILLITGTAGAVAVLAGMFLYLEPQIPDAREYRNLRPETPLRILSSDGKLIAEFGERRVIPMGIDEMPQLFVQAVLNTEDKRFYEHIGVDLITLMGTTLELLASGGEITRGGSTITMQLARQASLSLDRVFIRKFKEILLALKLEREFSKQEILELYLNLINFGKRAYGAGAAAMTYYGKDLNELNLAQQAMLAGIPQRPSANNPINGPAAALARRNVVLSRMLEQKTISRVTFDATVAQPITARVHDRALEVSAPYVAEWVRGNLVRKWGLNAYTDGLVVHTTIDSRLQAAANSALQTGLRGYDRRHGYRGPEGRTSVLATDAGLPPAVLAELANIKVRDHLIPAVVRSVEEQRFSAGMGNGRTVWVERRGWRWARPLIDYNSRGPAPETADQVVQPGDLIRLQELTDDDTGAEWWRLTQIPEIEGALVSLHPNTGAVDAYVGGYNFFLSQFDHVRQNRRQPGSGIKPFIYASALRHGQTASSIFLDAPLVFADATAEGDYRPRNSSGTFRGPMRLREALYRSVNLVTMRVVLEVGTSTVLEDLPRFGFNVTDFPNDLQIALGGGTIGVAPLDMVGAYAVLANGGYRIQPHVVAAIEGPAEYARQYQYPLVCEQCPVATAAERAAVNAAANPAANRPADALAPNQRADAAVPRPGPPRHTAERTMDARDIFILNSMLRDVVRYGTARRARVLNRGDIAGKTGTTDAADVWFNGFQRNRVTTVWMGFDDNTPLGDREFGSNGPLPIWIDFMRVALQGQPETYLTEPNGIVRVRIDPTTGQRAVVGAPDAIFEIYRSDNTPAPAANPGSTNADAETTVDPYDLF